MAISGKDLEYKIKVETSAARKAIEQVTGATEELNETTTRVERTAVKATTAAAGGWRGFRASVDSVGIPLIALNQGLELVERATRKLAQTFQILFGGALQLETQVAKINTLLTEQERITVNAGKGIQALQKNFGTSQQDSADAYYRILSSGAVDAADAQGFLEKAVKLSVGGVTSLTDSTEVLTSVMAAYGMKASDVAHISDALFIAARDGKTDVRALALELGNTLGISAQLGVSFDEVVSAVSALTLSGISTSEAVTSVNSAMVSLSRQTEEMSDVLRSLGITSIQSAVKQKGLVGVIREVAEASGGSSEAVINLMGRFEAMKAVAGLTSDNIGRKFDEMHVAIKDSSNNVGKATNDAYELIANTAEYQFGILKQRVLVLFAEMGGGIVESFTAAAKSINESLDTLSRNLEGFRAAIGGVDFSKLGRDAAIFAAELVAVAGAFTVVIPLFSAMNWTAFLGGIQTATASFGAMKAAILAAIPALKAFLASSAGVILMGVKFIAIAAAIDIIARNLGQLSTVAVAVFGNLTGWVLLAAKAVVDYSGKIASLLEALGATEKAEKFRGWIQGASDSLGTLLDDLATATEEAQKKTDWGFLGTAIETVTGMMDRYGKAVEKPTDKVGSLGAAIADTAKKAQAAVVAPNPETIRRYDHIKESIRALQSEIDKLSMSEADAAKAAATRALVEISSVEKALSAERRLTGERKKILDQAAALTIAKRDAELKSIAQKTAQAQLDANVTYAQALGNQTEIARAEYAKQLSEYQALLDKKLISDEQYADLKAAAEKKKALGEAKGSGQAAGEFGQKGITQSVNLLGSFMDGFSASLLGPVAAVQGVVSIAQGIVDAIPNLLNSLANLVTSVVELPTKIADGVVALVKAIPRLISEFIPRILEAIPTIIFSILEMLVVEIPNAFLTLFAKIPMFVEALMKSLPQIVVRLVEGFITAIPKIALGLVNFIINGIPAIIRAIANAIPEIVNAIIQGLIDGVMMIGDMIASIFTGGSWFKEFGESAAEAVQSSFKSLTNVGSKVFSLENVTEGPVADVATRATRALKQVGRTITNWLMQAWEAFKQAGRWLDSNIFQPAWNAIKSAFTWVLDNVFAPIGNTVMKAFQWVVDNILTPMANIVKVAFQWVVDNILAPITGIIRDAFTWVFESFGKVGSWIFNGLKAAMEGAGSLFAKLGTWIWEGLTAGLSSIGNVLSKMFSFDGGGRGAVEKFIGMDFPFVAFAEGGVVPGRASVPGDSLKNDKVPALLSPGEIVLPRSLLEDEAFRRLVLAKMQGKDVPQFGLGGFVGGLVSGAKAVGGAIASGAGKVWDGITSGASKLGSLATAMIPQWIIDLYKSLSRFVSDVSLPRLVANPTKEIDRALKSSLSVFSDFFKRMVRPMGFAMGGLVPGSTDTVPAMLTPGEFVLNRSAVRGLGRPLLETLNATGSLGSTGGHVENHITLNIKTEQPIDERFIRDKLIPQIEQSLRRASLDGRRVLSPAGVRA